MNHAAMRSEPAPHRQSPYQVASGGMPARRWVGRTLGITAGVLTHVLFAATVWQLFWFLKRPDTASAPYALWTDSLLALQFAVPHSWLLHPATRKHLGRWIAPPFYGLFFCSATCCSLLVTIALWRTTNVVIWDLTGVAGIVIQAGFLLSWCALFYSIYLTGLGYQTGLTPWLTWVRRKPMAKRAFRETGWYRRCRHPIYLSFLGLIWFTPRMTLDHSVLTGIWTVYIFVGSWLKDRRLEHYCGRMYCEYEARVPGYPFMKWGPLGLRRGGGLSERYAPEPS